MFKKKITGILCGAIILSSIGTVALAGNTSFNLIADPNINSGMVYSGVATKDDSDQYWYVNTKGGDISPNNLFFYSMAKKDENRVSSWNQVYSLGKVSFQYDLLENNAGKMYRLLADTDRYITKVSGEYCP